MGRCRSLGWADHREHNGTGIGIGQKRWRGERDDYRRGKRPIYVDVCDGVRSSPSPRKPSRMFIPDGLPHKDGLEGIFRRFSFLFV